MNPTVKRVLFWTPRVLGVLILLFISLFALDVFSEGYGVGEAVLAFLIHLIPSFIIILVLVIAWRWELVGGILFIAAGLFFLIMSRDEGWIISAPLILIGVLFLVSWKYGAGE